MTDIKAADLPLYSVVATRFATWIKVDQPGYMWLGSTTPPTKSNEDIDRFFTADLWDPNGGAEVLRVGNGGEQ